MRKHKFLIWDKKCLSEEAVDDFLPTLNFVADCFAKSKMIKKLFTALYADENMLFLMKILVMLYLNVMKWIFLILILIILILIISLMKIILVLFKNAKHTN